ncbi:MAG: hypothetical protein RL757_2424 [Bacteroidota bacterium]|jgi:hypothetical protein
MKNLKIFLFLLPLCAVAWSGCKKEEPQMTIVDGVVREFGTQKPLAGVRARIVEVGAGNPLGGTNVDILGVDTTDAEGRYHFELSLDKLPDGVYLNVPQGYSPYNTERGAIKKGQQNNLIHDLDPYAYVDLHIKNINPFDNTDYIEGNLGGTPISVTGNIDSRGIVKILSNRICRIDYVVTKNNIRKVYSDSLYVSARDTVKYSLHY